jgi:hypothetical protein
MRRDLFGSAGGDEFPSPVAAFRAEVDDVIRLENHVQIVLDQDHRVAPVDEELNHFHQLVNIGEMESGCRLIENVEGLPCSLLAQLEGELDALRFAAGEGQVASVRDGCRSSPTSLSVSRLAADLGHAEKKSRPSSTVISRTSESFLPLIANIEGLPIVALPVALTSQVT